ncbi:MAG: hypothetical protein COW24_00885 [Candidatus Kerfeldbacteria bacterium CG15_BIG_FIL_POST_REV_8_21_14_020_45_12]|uniref:UDP-N-acetyl-alpha-D-muramoyl-L-alanyl-L-glutamate epimerase n=1 Tax=Candidatus Kerfeldbacteria bacterium CG15_BIG_FIL_POST_REV_8_21_14_020_45_12 TaxID=2014247 RepID=A0A2M7H4Z2_9BACT|nr:MAG: hypothetical protein COW24_00885 [Candidatus Kerfeldbacteria bacterium CG15_BIG_FIL_POST_REV_8_21_14_020_45_12]PJA93525.1 MAG: hypothetical protein CO132_02745 [Candidatus Kerfeldbacteria bacterium CG_4_9_14_3_um_filter_45_8]
MNRSDQTFTFKGYTLDTNLGVVQFHFSFDSDLRFTETWELKTSIPLTATPLVERILFHAQFAIGASYWKTYCPKKIQISSEGLTDQQAEFWNRVYTKGLGEFFFKNQIDFRNLVNFPVDRTQAAPAISTNKSGRLLLPLGGGKDSLSSAALLTQMHKSFDTFSLGSYPVITQQGNSFPGDHFVIERTLDGNLFDLNDQDAYNGHVPISMIYAFAALLVSAIEGHEYIAISNERSANEGNLEYLGNNINHQWSKSFEFEKLFSNYVEKFISPDLHYFSLLRPLSELHIAKIFSEQTQWHNLFTSCNRNFARTAAGKVRWCGQCPKCAFVFVILAPFMPKAELVNIFQKNILADGSLLTIFQDLLGETNQKPFDCVGTPEEVVVAFHIIKQGGEYKNDVIMEYVDSRLPNAKDIATMRQRVFTPESTHLIPDKFQTYLNDIPTLE